ncbi:OmpP1/FadL family transporter [Methylorubrum extorquens]|uniref:Membrane protein involved in aromatic hydrocarbon degradation n=1 Tax=Methylorubrum extorquens (strain CM4 / NCIMB 13688) TaxID=440085 RepID=B7KN37_METC4|nr:porin [Methylorubrum extorquens]ACK85154.1 membrane protein involved in aromatic hydrocarbon degradation [Methylorubrum extorquens CM4]
MTGGTIRALGLAGAVAAVSMAGAGGAQAGAFGLREQSAQGLGVAFAGAASGGAGVSSIFWNPATVTMRPGFASEQSLSFINLSGEITPTVGTAPGLLPFGASGEVGQGAVVPSGATSYQLTDRLWVGIQTGAPYGLVTKPRQDWAGAVYARSSRIFSLAFNPVVGFKVNDWLSVAAGPSIEYFRLTLRAAVPVAGTFPGLYPSGFIKGESWGVGFTAGVLITPAAGTAIGVGYRSSVHHDIAGSIGFPDPRQAIALGQVRANLNTPEKVSVGLTQAINPVTRINLGFEWDNWSRLGDVGIVSRALGVTVNHLPLNFKDSFFYSIGAEYDWSPNLTLRAGFGYDNVPIDFSNRSARLPDSDRYVVSIGGSYRWSEKVLLTASYAHAFFDRGLLLAGPGRDYNIGNIPLAASTDVSADVVSVGFRYQWDAPAAVAPAPLVRKF